MRSRHFITALVFAALCAGPLAAVTKTRSPKDLEQNSSNISHAPLPFTVLDAETGKPVPCCIYLKDAAGHPVQPRGWPFWHDHFACAGVAELDLPLGAYTYEIDRGPEYLLTTGKFLVSGNSAPAVTCQIRRLANLANDGWWSGELHVHRPMADIELLMQAADSRINNYLHGKYRTIKPAHMAAIFEALGDGGEGRRAFPRQNSGSFSRGSRLAPSGESINITSPYVHLFPFSCRLARRGICRRCAHRRLGKRPA